MLAHCRARKEEEREEKRRRRGGEEGGGDEEMRRRRRRGARNRGREAEGNEGLGKDWGRRERKIRGDMQERGGERARRRAVVAREKRLEQAINALRVL